MKSIENIMQNTVKYENTAKKNTKKTFTINVHYQMTHTMEVEAENEEQAKAIAEENFGNEDFCNDDFDCIVDSCICNS